MRLLKYTIIILALLIVIAPVTANTADPDAVCGDDQKELGEDCDGLDSELCPGRCTLTCECPPNLRGRQDIPDYRDTIFLDVIDKDKNYVVNSSQTQFTLISLNFRPFVDGKNVTINLDPNLTYTEKAKKPQGVVYEYFNLSAQNLNDTYINNYNIKFKVAKTWIKDYNIKLDSVDLHFISSPDTWGVLGAVNTHEDSKYHFYEYKFQSGNFYTFAVVGDNSTDTIVTHSPICGDGIQQEGENSENCCVDAGCSGNLQCLGTACREVSVCGNNYCDADENILACPEDCSRDIFFSPAYFLLVSILILVGILSLKLFVDKKAKAKPRVKYAKWRKN